MASIHLQGTLLDTLGEVDVGAVMTWTHLTNTGEVIATTKRDLIIPPNGFYSIDVEFGQIRIDYRTRNTERFIATVIVNGTSTATTIPELLNAAVPVTDPVILEMQDILADAVAAAVTSEAFADQLTTTDLIGSVAVFAPDTNFRTKGYLTSGDGGAGHWVQNGVTAQPVSQSPAQLGDALLNDGNGNQWSLVLTDQLNVKSLGAIGDNVADDTKAIQAGINHVNSIGGGVVKIPAGHYRLSASTETDIFVNYLGAPVPATNCCLVIRPGVRFSGESKSSVTLQSYDFTKHQLFLADALDTTIEDLKIEGVGPDDGGGAGIFNVTSTSDGDVIRATIRRIFITNFGGYGIGLNAGFLINTLIEDCETAFTGSDGIDCKSRSSNVSEVNTGNTITNFTARAFGKRVAGATGVDLRGEWNVDGIHARGFSTGIAPRYGLRLRPPSQVNDFARFCNVNNVTVDGDGSADNSGVFIDGLQCNVSNVTCQELAVGVQLAGESDGTNLSNINVNGNSDFAISIGTNAQNVHLTNCFGKNENGASAYFRIEGIGCTAVSCSGDGTINEFSVASIATDSFVRLGLNALYNDTMEIREVTGGRSALQARGPSTNIDIAISPKGTGQIRYGTHASITSETVTGFINIKDSSGVVRKLAVLS